VNPLRSEQQWFSRDRFGLFIHWGVYAVAARAGGATGYTEWLRHDAKMTEADYQRYVDHFDPDLYDPCAWARAARNAGMRYAVLTTKHHDGFCLWDSSLTEYKATNAPAGRDLVAEFVEAFRAEGLRIGFYYSVIDWHHEDFPVDGLHPQREDLVFRELHAHRDGGRYADYLHGQVRELLTRYGQIDDLWFDFSYAQHDWGWSQGKGPQDWRATELLEMIYALQPGIVVNNRLGIGGDFVTPEQTQPLEWPTIDGQRIAWETCLTMNASWGYRRDDHAWKDAALLARTLVDAVSKGGNLLLNVGPTARGEFPPEAVERLQALGAWLRTHGKSIYDCSASEFTPPPDCRYTQSGTRLYLHLQTWLLSEVHLPGLAGRVAFARLLSDGSELRFRENSGSVHDHVVAATPPGTLTLELPVYRPDVLMPVVELWLIADEGETRERA
jgi:alpha-L-fucosidase